MELFEICRMMVVLSILLWWRRFWLWSMVGVVGRVDLVCDGGGPCTTVFPLIGRIGAPLFFLMTIPVWD